MTSRQLYEAVLIELNKENAPSIMLEDFNYFSNKAVNQYINKRYNIYDINQQTTDDLRVLKSTAILTPLKCLSYGGLDEIGRMMGATYEVILPSDYLHILNCICIYRVNKTFKCYNKGDIWRRAATRLTADAYSQVLDNSWNRPTYRRPYYYIHNVNSETDRIFPPTDDRRPISKIPYNTNKYYIGRIEPTSSNYQSLLDQYGTTSLEGLVNVGTEVSKIYVIYPENESIILSSSSRCDTLATTLIGKYSGYRIICSVNPVIGDIDGNIYVTGSYSRNNVEIGTDYKLKDGAISNIYENKEIDEIGVNQYLGTDGYDNNIYTVTKGNGVPTSMPILLGDGTIDNISTVERAAQIRYGNASIARMEIRYGTDTSVFELSRVYIDYIKAPQHIRLTQEQLDLTEDTSQVLEYPDYVCQEIINELVHIIMENIGDQKLQTHPVVSQSIANPAQAQTEPVAQAS